MPMVKEIIRLFWGIGYNANGKGDNTFVLGDTSITGLYCQATQITQSCDPRLKENIEDVDVAQVIDALMQIKVIRASYRNLQEFKGSNEQITQSCDPRLKENIEDVDVAQVIDALMQIKVIRASYRNLQEFKGSNENDKHKLMWDANNMSNIPLFAKDVKSQDMIVTPLNENGEYLKTRTIAVTEQEETNILDKNGVAILKDVEVEKEVPETETIEECKEFTPNQIMQALVIGFQQQQRMILQLQEKIKKLEGGIYNEKI